MVCALALISLSSVASAEDSGTSRENTNIEAQGQIPAAGWLAKNGQVGTAIEIPFQSTGATGPITVRLDMNVNMVAPYIYGDYSDTDLSFANFEAKVEVVQGKSGIFSPKLVRADLIKFLFPYVGITVQGLGYEFRRVAGEESHGFHLASLTVNEAIVVSGGERFQNCDLKCEKDSEEKLAIIVKGQASFGPAWQGPTSLSPKLEENWCRKGYCGEFSLQNEVSGSVGIRIMKRALVEVFGGLDQMSLDGRNLRETTVGAKVRGLFFDGAMQPYASIEKRHTLARAFEIREESDSVVLTVGVTANW